MARIDIPRISRAYRSPTMRTSGRREPGLLLAVVLVIAVAPIGWFNAVGQLFLPTSVPSTDGSAPQSARRAAAAMAMTGDAASPTATVPMATATARAETAETGHESSISATEIPAAPLVEAVLTASVPPTGDPTAGTSLTSEPIAAHLTLTPTPRPRDTSTAVAIPTSIPPSPTPTQPPAALITYVVQQGDTLWSIASRHHVDVNRLRTANRLDADATIRVGQTLYVPQIDGVVHVIAASESLDLIARQYGVDPETIVQPGGQRASDALSAGGVLMIPGAFVPIPSPSPTAGSRAATLAQTTSRAAVQGETQSTSRSVSGNARLQWPAYGGISTLYGEDGHSGLDIMGYTGQPVVAAAAGIVILAVKSDDGYGWRIDVDHGGFTTLYAHLSSFSVTTGEQVAAGQQIGSVGNTGLSTGPHLHFEVRAGGRIVDPMDYLR